MNQDPSVAHSPGTLQSPEKASVSLGEPVTSLKKAVARFVADVCRSVPDARRSGKVSDQRKKLGVRSKKVTVHSKKLGDRSKKVTVRRVKPGCRAKKMRFS